MGVWKGSFLVVLGFNGWLVGWVLEMALIDVLGVGGCLVGFLQAWDVHTNPKIQKPAWLLW